MVTNTPERWYQRFAWVILFVLGILLVVNILVVAGVADPATEFQDDTGTSWQAFEAAYPGVANAYMLNQRLLFANFGSLTLFALAVTYFAFRKGQRWAWFAMWLFAATLTLTGILFDPLKRPDPGAVYAVFAAVTVVGLLLPIRKFFPKQT